MIEEIINTVKKLDINTIALIITIFLAVIGWIVALFLQRKNLRDQHKIQIRYDIYKQFVTLRKEVQDSINKLGTSAEPPFISMSSDMVPFDLKLTKQYGDMPILWSEEECLTKAGITWNSFVDKLYYACGHEWNGISIHEKIEFKELIKIKIIHEGIGKLRRIVQGWMRSGDKKLKNGVDVYMDVNKEKNEFHHIVKEHKTEKVLHEEHEPLTKHGKKK